ncbi:MAG: hypothetical protein FWD05_01565 [Oscillospiraceae bacterium]|nr:hypothetical protein [Oscillospiraceae bacterium]
MKNIDKKMIRQIKKAYPVSPLKESNMQATISQAKLLLLENTKYNHSLGFFIWSQIKNISPFFWLLQLLCFVYMMWNVRGAADIESIRILFAMLVPVLVLYMLPELYKMHINNMTELEAACAHSPAKIVASKLLILSTSNFIVITMISFVFGLYHQLNVATILAQGLIPLNISISISLLFFEFVKFKSPYAMLVSAVLIAVTIAAMMQSALLGWPIYIRAFEYWQATLFVSAIILFALMSITLYRANHAKEWYYGT